MAALNGTNVASLLASIAAGDTSVDIRAIWSAGFFSDRSRAGSCCGGVVLVAGLGLQRGAVAQA